MCTVIFPYLVVVLISFGLVIYPLWMIIHCVTSSLLDGKTKTIWIVSMVFTWSLGAIFYGLFCCEKKSIAWTSTIILICLGLLSIPVFVVVYKSVGQTAVGDFAKVDQLDENELSYEESTIFNTSVETLQIEVKSSDLDKVHKALNFSELFDIYTKDNKITQLEYQNWISKFNNRSMLDRDAFSNYVRKQR